MRISDWSSDVCSSDLVIELPGLAKRVEHGADIPIERVDRGDRGLPVRVAAPLRAVICAFTLALVQREARPGRIEPGPRQVRRRSLERTMRSEEHTSELQSLMRISYAVFCLKKKKNRTYSL